MSKIAHLRFIKNIPISAGWDVTLDVRRTTVLAFERTACSYKTEHKPQFYFCEAFYAISGQTTHHQLREISRISSFSTEFAF